MAAATRSGYDASPLRQRLAALRRRLYFVATVRGVGWLLTVLVATAIVAGVLDWRWHLPSLVRAVFLVAALAGAAIIAVRYLFKPLSARADDLALALRVEERYPALNDALASTVQFLNLPPDSDHDSSSMRREAMRRALRLMTGLDFNRVVDSRGILGATLSMAAALAVGLLLLWIDPVMARTALVRFVNPFGGRDWPHLSQLDSLETRYKKSSNTTRSSVVSDWQALAPQGDAAPIRLGKGYEFHIQGTVTGRVIPKQVAVVFLHNTSLPVELTCDVTFDEETKTHRFATKLKPDQVQRAFSFFVRAGDDTSKEFKVEVLAPPALLPLSPQVELRYPKYTGLPSPQTMSPGTGNVDAVQGTVVTLRAQADRPLRDAWIEFQPDDKNVVLAAVLAPLGAAHPLGAAALTTGGQAVYERVPARFESDRSRFTIDFLPRVHGSYVLNFEDETGLLGSRSFELRLRTDPAPVVQLVRPAAARDILHVLPDAELPLHVLADDPVFALRSVFVVYRTLRTDEPRMLPLYDNSAFAHRSVAPLSGPAVLAAKEWKLRPTSLEFRRTLSLKSLSHRNGISLHEGDIVIIQAGADDFDDVTFNKQPGLSHEVEIHIVGRNALEIELNREQAKVQQELMRLREKERDALKIVTDVENKLKKGEKLSEEDLAKLLQAEQAQQQIHERVGDDKEGLRAEVNRLLQTLKQNQLQNSAVKDRMQDVQRELDRLAEKEFNAIEQRLAEARKLAELDDDKARADSKAALDKRAQESTDKANAATKDADKKAEEAFQDEAKADRLPDGEAEKERLNAEAKRLKKEAAELQKKAEQLKQQAERARKDAASGGSSQPRELLDEARLHQEEVEKTLNDLLTRLEPWSSTSEIKGEANKLLEEQRKLYAELEERKKELLGKGREELTEPQKQQLQELEDAQQKIQERTEELLKKMDRISKERADKDPEAAKELQDARDQAMKEDVTGQMKQARENTRDNKLQDAQKNQDGAIKGMKKMVRTLEDRREAELDRLVKKMKEAEKQLDELAVEQEELQKKIRDAQKLADPKEREEALKKLGKQQKDLQQKTQDMIKQLSRLRAERASSALSKANGEMDEANGDLARGQKADEKLDDALDRIDEAQRELEQARQRAEDQLRREQLGRVEETIKSLRDRQEAFNKEAGRIQTEVQRMKVWSRSLTQGSLKSLEINQKDLGNETAEVARKELAGTPVFAKLVQKSADVMAEASARLKAMVSEPPPVDQLPDEELKRLQQDALRRLDQLLDAVKSEMAALDKNAGGGSAGSGGNGGGSEGGNRGPDGLPPLAQLKLLRMMQEDVNKRTEAFTKAHPALDKLTDKEKTELAGIRADQHDIELLLEELRKGDEPDGPEGDKK